MKKRSRRQAFARGEDTGKSGKLAKHAKTRVHILLQERIHDSMSVNRPIDDQLVEIAEATKARKEKEREENRQMVQTIFDVWRSKTALSVGMMKERIHPIVEISLKSYRLLPNSTKR